MSQYAVIRELVEDQVRAALAGLKGSDGGDVTQLKRENTGLRNRVKELEDRVTALENAGKPVTASAQTAKAAGRASGK